MSKQLVLPKTDKDGISYLSYSQISTWIKSKRDYIRQYFFKEGFEGNAYTDFGSKVGEAFENADFSQFEFDEQLFLESVPVYQEFERKIKLQMEGFYVVGYIDTNTTCLTKLADYKTGDIEKKRADYESESYNQLEIYAAAIEQETGILPDDVKVFLIGRAGNAFQNEELTLTKEYITITRDVTPEKVAAVKALVQKTAEEISAYYTMYLKLNGLI